MRRPDPPVALVDELEDIGFIFLLEPGESWVVRSSRLSRQEFSLEPFSV